MFFFFFTWGGGSPFVGEKRAFMAEPSARPAINDMLDKKMRCRNAEKKNHKKINTKKWRKRISFVLPTGSENFSPAGRSRRDEVVKSA